VSRRQSLRTVARKGLRLTIGADKRARVRVVLRVSSRTTRRLHLHSTVVGTRTLTVGPGRRSVRIRLNRDSARRLDRHRRLVRIQVTLKALGNSRPDATARKRPVVRLQVKRTP
jgi:hypothetical protein